MRIPGLSPRRCDSRLCACRTVRLNNAAARMVGTITHARHGCRDEIRFEDVETPASNEDELVAPSLTQRMAAIREATR